MKIKRDNYIFNKTHYNDIGGFEPFFDLKIEITKIFKDVVLEDVIKVKFLMLFYAESFIKILENCIRIN